MQEYISELVPQCKFACSNKFIDTKDKWYNMRSKSHCMQSFTHKLSVSVAINNVYLLIAFRQSKSYYFLLFIRLI